MTSKIAPYWVLNNRPMLLPPGPRGQRILLSLPNSTIKDRTLFVSKCAKPSDGTRRLLSPFREQPGQPSRRECGWEGEAQWRTRAFRCKHPLVDQGRNNTARLPVAGANDIGYVAARQLAAIEHGFENTSRFRRRWPSRTSSSLHMRMRVRKRSG